MCEINDSCTAKSAVMESAKSRLPVAICHPKPQPPSARGQRMAACALRPLRPWRPFPWQNLGLQKSAAGSQMQHTWLCLSLGDVSGSKPRSTVLKNTQNEQNITAAGMGEPPGMDILRSTEFNTRCLGTAPWWYRASSVAILKLK